MKNDVLKSRLLQLADEKYRDFSSKLLPKGEILLGVRLPILRRIAKEILKGDFGNVEKFLEECESEFFEEDMLESFVIAGLKVSLSERKSRTSKFVGKIKNWSVCDSFCCSLKNFVKDLGDEFFPFLQKFLKSKNEYECRFALVMFLMYALNDSKIDETFEKLKYANSDAFYAEMSLAWLLAESYQNYPEKVRDFLNGKNCSDFVYKKTLQKIRDKHLVYENLSQR